MFEQILPTALNGRGAILSSSLKMARHLSMLFSVANTCKAETCHVFARFLGSISMNDTCVACMCAYARSHFDSLVSTFDNVLGEPLHVFGKGKTDHRDRTLRDFAHNSGGGETPIVGPGVKRHLAETADSMFLAVSSETPVDSEIPP